LRDVDSASAVFGRDRLRLRTHSATRPIDRRPDWPPGHRRGSPGLAGYGHNDLVGVLPAHGSPRLDPTATAGLGAATVAPPGAVIASNLMTWTSTASAAA